MASTRTERRRAARGKIFARDPGSLKPFKRAIALHQQFVDTLAAAADALPIDRQIAVQALPPYVSRGHGGRYRVKQRIVGSRQFQDRSKYAPRLDTWRNPRAFKPVEDESRAEGLLFADIIVAKTAHDPRAV